MLNRYLTYYKPATQFVVFCAILSMSFIVGAYALEMLNPIILGMDSQTFQALKEYPSELIPKLKWSQFISIFLVFGLPGMLFSYLAYPSMNRYLGFVTPQRNYYLLWGATLMLIALPFSTLLEQWNARIPMSAEMAEMNQHYEHLAMAMLKAGTWVELFYNTMLICIVPAIIEELLFRGVIQQIFSNWLRQWPFVAILFTAIIFSLLHFELSGFLPRLFLGFLLGYAYYITGSLWVSILMHALNNFLIVWVAYLSQTHQISFSLSDLPDMPIWIGLSSLAVTLGFAYLFYKHRIVFPIHEVDKTDSES